MSTYEEREYLRDFIVSFKERMSDMHGINQYHLHIPIHVAGKLGLDLSPDGTGEFEGVIVHAQLDFMDGCQ